MKSIILKALVLPVAAFALASAGAISTNTAKESKANVAVAVDAYIHNPTEENCEKVLDTDCSPGGGPTCLSGPGNIAFGMNAEGSCNVQLHRN